MGGRAAPAARALRSRELVLALAAGAAVFVLSAFGLGPWPDLLGEDARRMGQMRWYVEVFKSLVPPVLALAATMGMIAAFKRRLLGPSE
jgi:hypothetical protein